MFNNTNKIISRFILSFSLVWSANVFASPEKVLEPCHVDDLRNKILCGTLKVPENYQNTDGKKIALNIAVVPAVKKNVTPDPLVFLAGGPGQAATEVIQFARVLRKINTTRDLVFIDQRGTGKSAPLLCEDEELNAGLFELNDKLFDVQKIVETCLESYDNDLSQFNTENAIRDFEEVRKYLGYKKVNIYGGSYGTRAGLVYMRMFPGSIRSAILDSVAPTQVVIGPFGKFGARAFEMVLASCEAQPQCAAAYPNLRKTFLALVDRLEQQPLEITIRHPSTNEPETFLVTDTKLVNTLRGALYSTTTHRLVPVIIQELANDNPLPLAGLMAANSSSFTMYTGLTMNIICSEDMSRATPALLQQDANNEFISGKQTQIFVDYCKYWPKYPVAPEFSKPVVSDIPTFILSGDFDPVTPPEWGELAKENLKNSRHFIVKNAAHVPLANGCIVGLVHEFLNSQDLNTIDQSCLDEIIAKPYFVNSNAFGIHSTQDMDTHKEPKTKD
ncbi:MAG: alpha/beta fold hydrolase [Pseudomonadota bacterium]